MRCGLLPENVINRYTQLHARSDHTVRFKIGVTNIGLYQHACAQVDSLVTMAAAVRSALASHQLSRGCDVNVTNRDADAPSRSDWPVTMTAGSLPLPGTSTHPLE